MERSRSIRPTKEGDLLRRYRDLLEIARLVKNTDLGKEAGMIYEEVQALETQLERFEKYIGI